MALLYGEYDLTLDEKNRLLIPAEVRRMLDPQTDGEAFFLVPGINRVPWLWPEKAYARVVSEQRPSRVIPQLEELAFDQANFGMIVKLEWDRQGRVVIPDKTMRRIRLERDLTLVGVRDHLELWPRTAWEEKYAKLDQERAEIALRAATAQPPGTAGQG